MPRKTKKQKLFSQQRKTVMTSTPIIPQTSEKTLKSPHKPQASFQYNYEGTDPVKKTEAKSQKTEKNITPHPVKKDLLKILAFTLVALAFQFVLYSILKAG